MNIYAKIMCIWVLLLITAPVLAGKPLSQEIFINEVMQSTFGGEYDLLNEYPDGWIELYNPNNSPVSLKGWRVGKKKFKKSYGLPDVSIPAKGYLVIMCDKAETVVEDPRNPNALPEIHTDFRITTDKESALYLYNKNGDYVDSVSLPVMVSPNVAWGRHGDGSETLGWELKVTKGSSNQGGLAKMVLSEPRMVSGSVVTSEFSPVGFRLRASIPSRNLSKQVENLTLRYTLDGSEPTEMSPLVEGDLYISDRNVIYRAKLFADSCVSVTAPAVVCINVGHNITLPVVSVWGSDEDMYSQEHGIIKNNNSHDYKYDWRRPAFFDYFKNEGMVTLSQRCEVRVAGGWTRENSVKSLVVYANDRFGTPDFFSQQFWPATRPEVTKAPSIMLRSAGNDFGDNYVRDAVAQLTMGGKVDLDWQAFQPAIYFLNLEYQGIINIRERANEDNVWANYEGLEDVTLVENRELKEGEQYQYEEFLDFFNTPGHTLEEIQAMMDVSEYMNHMILNAYMGNTDFPGNNNVMWRPIEAGGRWRWIVKDVDRSFNLWGSGPAYYDYLKWLLVTPYNGSDGNTPEGTKVIKYLMANPDFKELFIDRYTVLLGTVFRPSDVNAVIDWCYNTMSEEMNVWRPNHGWKNRLEDMKNWNRERNEFMKDNLKDFFKLGDPVKTTLNRESRSASQYNISINSTPLPDGSFDGVLYADRTYSISGTCKNSAYEVQGWEVKTISKSGMTTVDRYDGSELVIEPVDGTKSMEITPLMGTNGIEELIYDYDLRIVETVYVNPQGMVSSEPFKGINVARHTLDDGTVVVDKYFGW